MLVKQAIDSKFNTQWVLFKKNKREKKFFKWSLLLGQAYSKIYTGF